MKKQRILAHALLALVGAALFAAPAKADTITPAYSDLILGFRVITLYDDQGNELPAQGGGSGGGFNLMIDIGAASQFYSPTSTTFTISSFSVADVIAIYGTAWNTRTDLVWGVIGTTGKTAGTSDGHAVKNTIWATIAEDEAGTLAATPRQRTIASSQNTTIAKNIEPLFIGTAPLNGATSTENSSSAAKISSSASGSWSSLATDNGSFTLTGASIEGNTAISAGSYSVLDLYELQPSSTLKDGTYLGSFGLSEDGILTFSTDPSFFAPVPEPSTYALLGLAGCLMAYRSRRLRFNA